MEIGTTARRRWFGGIVLFGAVAMLICGETVLKTKLAATAYLVYWLICFLLTVIAIVVAFLDLRALQQRVRDEHRNLFETTLDRIETDVQTKKPKPQNGEPK